MTILPAIACAIAIGLAVVFEASYAYGEKRWSTPAGKDGWVCIFWLLVVGLLMLFPIMPYTPPGVFAWAPFIAVVLIHVFMVVDGDGFYRLPGVPPSNPPGSNHSTPLDKSHGWDVKKITPNNNQNA